MAAVNRLITNTLQNIFLVSVWWWGNDDSIFIVFYKNYPFNVSIYLVIYLAINYNMFICDSLTTLNVLLKILYRFHFE